MTPMPEPRQSSISRAACASTSSGKVAGPVLAGTLRLVLVALGGWGLAFAQADGPSGRVDLMLSEADEQRSSSPQQFSKLLDQLTLAKGEMSPDQRSYLDFLTAYQLAYSGQHQEAEILLKDLLLPKHAPLIRFRAAYTLANVQIVRRQFVDAFSSLAQTMAMLPEISEAKWRNQALSA